MKHILLLIATLSCIQIGTIQAQSFGIFPGTLEVEWDYTEDLDMKVFISSNSMITQDIEYTILTLDMPQQWQDNLITQFCDIQSCYDFRWFKVGDKKEMKLPANQKNGVMKVDFLLPFDTTVKVQPGSAEIAMGFALKGSQISDTLRFLVNRTANGINESRKTSELTVQSLGESAISVKVPAMSNRLAMYNINGVLIEDFSVQHAEIALLEIGHLANGLYVLQSIDTKGNSHTATFTKY